MKVHQLLLAVAAAAALVGAIHVLREATESTHYETGSDSRLEVVVSSRIHESEPTQSLDEITEAHLSACRLEVTSDIEAFTPVPGSHPRRYRVILRPALDSSNRKQFEGCVEDWNFDQNEIEVISMRNVSASPEDQRSAGPP